MQTTETPAQFPIVEFVDDVEAFMKLPENQGNAEMVLKRMEEVYSKAKIVEANNAATKKRLKSQVEELDKSIKMIVELKRNKNEGTSMSTHFRLSDQVFAKAKIPATDKVGLWLGANVMLEYDLEEGDKLLRSKRDRAINSLKVTNDLIDTIRENITTIEVNMARVYNWDVKRRQAEKLAVTNKKLASV